MAMVMEGVRSGMADMNVTPMIDILLVLLIIFIVIAPGVRNGLAATVPQSAARALVHHPERAIMVAAQMRGQKASSRQYKINGSEVAFNDLLPRLTAIFANRAERVIFVKGDEGADFQYVASIIDLGESAGVARTGMVHAGQAVRSMKSMQGGRGCAAA